jgi:NAD(P)H-nitrite reductase large subunit
MRYIIIGGSTAGISAIEAIRSVDRTSQIELFSEEETPFYSRVLLSYYIAGAITKEELHFRPLEFFMENNVKAFLGQKVQMVSPESKFIKTVDGREHPFDKLLIATGSTPTTVNIPGKDKPGVFVMRNIKHAQEVLRRAEETNQVCVLGGGLIGLRTGYALSVRGLKVKIFVKSGHVLSQMLDREAAERMQTNLREHGIEIRTGLDAAKIIGRESVEAIILDNGEKIVCQLVVIGKGVRPNMDLVSSSPIKVNEGIVADEHMRTSVPDIYVAGDVAETYDITRERTTINAIWPCAFEQGRVAGLNMAGRESKYGGSFRMNSLDFYNLPVMSMGITRPDGNGLHEVQRKTKDIYRKLVLKNGRIVGAILVGQVQRAGILATLLKKRIDVSDYVPFLMSDRLNFADLLPLMKQNADRFTEVEFRELSPSIHKFDDELITLRA